MRSPIPKPSTEADSLKVKVDPKAPPGDVLGALARLLLAAAERERETTASAK